MVFKHRGIGHAAVTTMRTLEKLTIRNFKSIRDQTLALGPLNIFIGGNGAGKSNLIEVFRFLREIVNQNLSGYTATKGGAGSLLHFGRKRSPEMAFRMEFGGDEAINSYQLSLRGTAEDGLVISEEVAAYFHPSRNMEVSVETGSQFFKESRLKSMVDDRARQVVRDLENCRIYHFHDTSDAAAVKGASDMEDNRVLRPHAENLAAFLYWMQQKEPTHFANIQDTLRQVAPFFDEFRLAPSKLNESKIRLEWKERGSDAYFNASSLSDGTLRFLCLITLLLQPELPTIILLDEPELGLHPAAVTLLADLLASAATRAQVIAATQSVTLINQFKPEEVWAVDRADNQSVFKRLSEQDMSLWMDDYALGELWEKNVFGARP